MVNDKALVHQDYLFKLIIIGDTGNTLASTATSFIILLLLWQSKFISYYFDDIGVGKSCLLARVMDNEFKVEH